MQPTSHTSLRTIVGALIMLTLRACRDSVGPPIAIPAIPQATITLAIPSQPRLIEPTSTDESGTIDWKPSVLPDSDQHYVWLPISKSTRSRG